MWIGHCKGMRKLKFRALAPRLSETIQQNQSLFYSFNNSPLTFEMNRIEPRWKANIGFFFTCKKIQTLLCPSYHKIITFGWILWICAFLDANVYQKQGKTLRTTRVQSHGINSKNRDNCEDEDQFKSHGHFVSKEARWNTALHPIRYLNISAPYMST